MRKKVVPKERARRGGAKQITVLEDETIEASPAPSRPVKVHDVEDQRKPLRPKSHNVVPASSPKIHTAKECLNECNSLEYESKLQVVQQVCDAIAREGELRATAIRAVTSAELSSFITQLDMQLSKFSPEVQNMSLMELLKSCPEIESVISYDGTVKLQRSSSPFPKLQESKVNLQEILAKAMDSSVRAKNSPFFTPRVQPATKFLAGGKDKHRLGQDEAGEDLDWPQYWARLQASSLNCGMSSALRRGLLQRLPKEGEAMLSINGSPLGQFGMTPSGSDSCVKTTRTRKRVGSTRKTLRDL